MTSPDMWMRLGACRKLPDHLLDTMYPDRAADAGSAKKVCAACPVKLTCRAWAIGAEEEHGVWGGLTYPERGDHIDHGTAIRPCPRCGLDWVPATLGQTMCRPCQAAPAEPAPASKGRTGYGVDHTEQVAAHRDEITRWAGEGWSDRRIANHLGTYETLIRRLRDTWRVPSGHAVRLARLRGTGHTVNTATVDAVQNGHARISDLNLAERVELWNRHAGAGGSANTFTRRYGISARSLRVVREAAEQGQAVAA